MLGTWNCPRERSRKLSLHPGFHLWSVVVTYMLSLFGHLEKGFCWTLPSDYHPLLNCHWFGRYYLFQISLRSHWLLCSAHLFLSSFPLSADKTDTCICVMCVKCHLRDLGVDGRIKLKYVYQINTLGGCGVYGDFHEDGDKFLSFINRRIFFVTWRRRNLRIQSLSFCLRWKCRITEMNVGICSGVRVRLARSDFPKTSNTQDMALRDT